MSHRGKIINLTVFRSSGISTSKKHILPPGRRDRPVLGKMERVTSAELRAAVKLTSVWKCHYKQLSLRDRIDAFHSRSGPSTKPVLTIERLVSNKTLVQSQWVSETLKFVIKQADEGPISILKRQRS